MARGEDRLLPDAPKKAQREILNVLEGRSAKVLAGDPVVRLGDGTGLAIYGRLSWRGRPSWWLKHRIDERFVAEHGG